MSVFGRPPGFGAPAASAVVANLNDPSQPSGAYQRMADRLAMIHTLRAGTDAMRAAGQEYLPQHPNETPTAYAARLQSTTLLNVLEDSIENAVSRVFDEQWRVSEDAAPELQLWAFDIDLKGTALHEFARQCMDDALTDGMVHVLVDYPLSPTRSVEDGTLDPYGQADTYDVDGDGEDEPIEALKPPVRKMTLAEERALGLRP
jgi:hypothetical protein